MSRAEMNDEERALLEAAPEPAPAKKGRPARPAPAGESAEAADKDKDAGTDPCDRGPHSPVQHEDDGWGDTPVQMRG